MSEEMSEEMTICRCSAVLEPGEKHECRYPWSLVDKLKAELESLKAEDKTYLRSEVNRLSNVIADRDWQIGELKEQITQAHKEGFEAARIMNAIEVPRMSEISGEMHTIIKSCGYKYDTVYIWQRERSKEAKPNQAEGEEDLR